MFRERLPKDWDNLLRIMDLNIANLKKLKQTSFIHKDLLGKVKVWGLLVIGSPP